MEILFPTTATAGFAIDCTATPVVRKIEQLYKDGVFSLPNLNKINNYCKNYFPLVNKAIDGFSNSSVGGKILYAIGSIGALAIDLTMNVAIKPTLGNAILTTGQLLGAFNPWRALEDAQKAYPENNYVAVAVLPFLYAKNAIQGIGGAAWGAVSRLPIANGINTDSDYTKGGFRGFGNKILSYLKGKPMEQQEINLNAECSKISKILEVSNKTSKSWFFITFGVIANRF